MEGDQLRHLEPVRRFPGETEVAFSLPRGQSQIFGIYLVEYVRGKGEVGLLDFQAEGQLLSQLPFGQIQGFPPLIDFVEVFFHLPGFQTRPAGVEDGGIQTGCPR